jgi:hypothetical protein
VLFDAKRGWGESSKLMVVLLRNKESDSVGVVFPSPLILWIGM